MFAFTEVRKEGIRYPVTGVTDDYELPGSAGNQIWILGKSRDAVNC